MSGNSFLIDTNIVLYLLSGDETLAEFLYKKDLFVSFISEVELLSYHKIKEAEHLQIKTFLNDCFVIEMNNTIKQKTIELRKQFRVKLPDAFVAASAIYSGIPLLSADNGFEKIDNMDLILYKR